MRIADAPTFRRIAALTALANASLDAGWTAEQTSRTIVVFGRGSDRIIGRWDGIQLRVLRLTPDGVTRHIGTEDLDEVVA